SRSEGRTDSREHASDCALRLRNQVTAHSNGDKMNAAKEIEANRRKIDDITHEIVELIRKRDLVVRRINKAKGRIDIPVVDSRREREVIRKARIAAKKLSVDPRLVEKIMKLVIKHSRGLR